MQHNDLNVLAAFLAVAEERSFTRAAKRLTVSRSALSYAIRGLEERIGVRLLARTTRSVAPTDAGEHLMARLRPALGDIAGVLDCSPGVAGSATPLTTGGAGAGVYAVATLNNAMSVSATPPVLNASRLRM